MTHFIQPLKFKLQHKLSLILFVLLLILGSSTWLLAQTTANRYSLEFYQQLNKPITMYMAGEQTFIRKGIADKQALKKLAHHVMIVNPSLEIYLLDAKGKILSHALPDSEVTRSSVSLAPVRAFLNGANDQLILGDDPRLPEKQNIFSVHPIIENGETQGYLYAILAGKNFQSLLNNAKASHTLVNAALLLTLCLALSLLSGIVAFYFITQRLRALTLAVNEKNLIDTPNTALPELPQSKNSDEIDLLISAFEKLLKKNQQQYERLELADNNRRELIANISHDLRTPLTSLQGYIETLLIKGDQLDPHRHQEFLNTAHKQSKYLGYLVADLFELAKLDNGHITPAFETFSLLELVHDLIQDFELKATEKHINIEVHSQVKDTLVSADIQLIQRVFENLMANALRYTPEFGNICIALESQNDAVSVRIENEGKAISESEREYIFKRYYRAHNPAEDHDEKKQHSGIGLAIVHKILQLHQCNIRLCNETCNGTAFIFSLPSGTAAAGT